MVLTLIALYILSALGLSLYGFNTLVLFILYWHHRQKCPATPEAPRTWPSVVVQLPVYNESHVVERLVSKVAALDYPKECLTIQVLDDSTDGTSAIAKELVESHRSRGVDIHLVRRRGRSGFKAGALAYGMVQTDAEFVAIFDADFLPPVDFLRRVFP
jgi:cellulose synthase/poly-beta-1,6-N-acetylglucosamine synthase-like glycosyltransferase